jgi:hypothetical protein
MRSAPCHSAIAWFAFAAILGLLAAPCARVQSAERTSFDERFDRLIADLESPQGSVRFDAARRLKEIPDWRLTLPRTTRLLQAAARKLPQIAAGDENPFGRENPEDIEMVDGGALLVGIVATRGRAEHILIVEQCYDKYSAEARNEALQLLMWLQTRDAAEATMRLIRKHAGNDSESIIHLWGWAEVPDCADVFFPELLDLAKSHENEENILYLLAAFVEFPETSIDVLDRCGPKIVELYRRHEKKLLPSQRAERKWVFYSKAYATHRQRACKLLDLMGNCPTDEGRNELLQAADFRDPLLKLHAAMALSRLGEGIPHNALIEIATDPETRIQLFEQLEHRDVLRLFPARYLSQAALAESDLVRWLINDSGKGCPPARIELVKVVTVDPQADVGLLDYYVFQFCMQTPRPGEEPAWKAGVAGPYPRSEQPTAISHATPHSEFEPIEAKWPEEHIGDLRQVIQEYRWRAGEED